MNAIMTVRYVSGRSEKFEIELWGGARTKERIDALLKTPNLAISTSTELILIPGSAVECVCITLPEGGDSQLDLGEIRSAKRLD
jgi:hypothetical protein